MKVLIVGAGISGITTLTLLRRAGIAAECVDRQARVSGAWVAAPDFIDLQTPSYIYNFPGRPFAPETARHGSRCDVVKYWESLVEDFQLSDYIALETDVVKAKRKNEGWEVHFKKISPSGSNNNVQVKFYDFLVVASGVYGHAILANEPKNIPGRDEFPGTVVHNSDLPRNWSPKNGKSVAVVGFGSTALGYLNHYATLDPKVKVHHIVRDPRWWIPRRFFGFIPFDIVFYCRMSAMFISSWFYGTTLEYMLHTYLGILVTCFWKFVAWVCVVSSRAPRHLIPKEDLKEWLRAPVVIMPPNYFESVRNGRIKTHSGSIQRLSNSGEVMLTSGYSFKADHVILCTGYKYDPLKWLDGDIRKHMLTGQGLYRHILLPDVKNLAFMGFSQGFCTPQCAYIAACWLVAYLKGLIDVPSTAQMRREIARVFQFKEENVKGEPNTTHVTAARYISYCDELINDMKMDPTLGQSYLIWLFARIRPDLYAGLLDELMTRTSKSKKED